MSRLRAALALALVAAGCSSPEEDPCSHPVDLTCTPAYPATYAEIHARTFATSCTIGGGACHGPAGRKAGINFANADEAYAALRANDRVVPGRPECSKLVGRIESPLRSVQMPPGAPLDPGTRCAIVSWIHAGAER